MIRHAAIAALVALSAMALVSCSSKSNKSASTVQSPTPAKQQLSHSSTAQASGVDIAAMSHLYLLAATPAQDYGYPATLYRVVEDKLKSVRELVPQTEGVRFVQSGETSFSWSICPARMSPSSITTIRCRLIRWRPTSDS